MRLKFDEIQVYDNYNDMFKYVEMQKKHLNKVLEEGSGFNVEEEKRRKL